MTSIGDDDRDPKLRARMSATLAATFAAFKPRIAILNNGAVKGGAPETFAALHGLPDVDVWQLHRSTNAGARNFSDDRIANLDETTAHWIKVRARDDGSFVLTNGRTGESKSYASVVR